MNAAIGLMLSTLAAVDGVAPGRFAVAEPQLIVVPTAAPGGRFAVAADLRQYAAGFPDGDSARRFALKGAVVAPGACAEVVFRDGYE